jgi:hypothetical protein
VKVTLVPVQNVLSASEELNETTGKALTVTFLVVLDAPELMLKEMVFKPFEEYVTLCGPTPVAVAGVAPAPKFQSQEVANEDASVTVTV